MQLELNLQHGENENSNNKSNKSKKIIVEKYYFKKPHRIFDAMLNKKKWHCHIRKNAKPNLAPIRNGNLKTGN